MTNTLWKSTAALAVSLALAGTSLAADNAQVESLQKKLDQQQKQIDELKKQVEAAVEATENVDGAGAASKSTFGGYGELHYGNYDKKAPDGASSTDDKAFDFHRFVLFFGHEFNDKVRFFSELELEHALAGEGKKGEVELEQAFIEYRVSDAFAWKAGLFLLPVGMLNETHEPPTFYGTERNRVESDIVPTTWWEGGVGATYRFADGLTGEFDLTSGLYTGQSFNIRSGRQKVSKAKGDALAYTGRLKYTAIPGLELATTLQFQSDLLQGEGTTASASEEASATLFEVHAAWQIGQFDVRALYAMWDIDSATAEAANVDKQDGWFIEPGFRINEMFGVFARYSVWDNGGLAVETEKKSAQFGINTWVHPNVVLKADYEKLSGALDDKGFNLGVGYYF